MVKLQVTFSFKTYQTFILVQDHLKPVKPGIRVLCKINNNNNNKIN